MMAAKRRAHQDEASREAAKAGKNSRRSTGNNWVTRRNASNQEEEDEDEKKLKEDRLKYLFLGDEDTRLLALRARYLEGEKQDARRTTRPSLDMLPEQRASLALQQYKEFQKSNTGLKELMGLGNSGMGMPGEGGGCI